MPTYDFVTVDVFTSERFCGNPLAVFPDARGLADAHMQAIAAEFGYSEITFVLPPESPDNDARVRIFTPTAEIPFAGHPNVGTAYVLGQGGDLFGKPVGEHLRFEEIAGLVEVALRRDGETVHGAAIRAPRPLHIGMDVDPALIARCTSLSPDDIATKTHQPCFTSVGLPFAIAELTGLDALARARPNIAVFHEAAERHRQAETDFSLFLYVRDPAEPARLRARMFAPLDNVLEDPATGSASAALGAFLASLAAEANADMDFTVEQGVEMGRRSVIDLTVGKRAGRVNNVRIGGNCAGVLRGSIDI